MAEKSQAHTAEMRVALAAVGLPIPPDQTKAALALIDAELAKRGVPEEDRSDTLERWISEWRRTDETRREFASIVTLTLKGTGGRHARRLANSYFKVHKRVRDQLALTHADATTLLGYADLIGRLAEDERMSAAQIASLLRARGVPRGAGTWAAVQKVLSALRLRPKVDLQSAKEQLQNDWQEEEAWFADARLDESIEMMQEAGVALGYPSALDQPLVAIVPNAKETSPHWPYLAMLHFSCIPLDWYDHDPVFPYEFSPRGQVASMLWEDYRKLGVRGNPFLNNAKSVDRLDSYWADSKDKLRPAASGLVEVLEQLVSMPYPAKQQLGATIRRWCLRQVRLHSKPARTIPTDSFTEEVVQATLECIAQSDTHTQGMLEQRVIDAITASMHEGSQWRPRGLGDAVNAANTPRRKLGDCEFQDTASRRVDAFEAHGGALTHAYVENHRAGLELLLERRIEDEWASYSDAEDWKLDLTFVAHETGGFEEEESVLLGVRVRTRYITYKQLLAETPLSGIAPHLRRHVLDVLNDSRTPQSVRDRLANLAGLSGWA